MSRWNSKVALLSLALITSGVASAQQAGGLIGLEALSAQYQNNQVVVEFRLQNASWRSHGERRSELVLNAQLQTRQGPAGQVMSVDLRRPRGQMVLDLVGDAEIVGVEVWASAASRHRNVDGLSLNGIEVSRASLRIKGVAPQYAQPQSEPQHWQRPQVVPPPPGPPPSVQHGSWAGVPAVIEACGSTFDGNANEMECMNLVARSRFDPTAVIAACDKAMDGDENELNCVRVAMGASGDPSPGLNACEAVMDGDENELACFVAITQARFDTGPLVKACEDAFDGDATELECIRIAANSRRDPSQAIAACEKGMDGDAAELECVKRALSR